MVKIIQWEEGFSVGVKEIDEQHKELVAILDDLYNAMLKAKGKEILEVTLQRLTDYTAKHFAMEERLFKKYNYPEARAHKAEHDAMLRKLTKFKKEHKRGELVGVDLMNFLKDWFINHLQTTDYRYVPFFKEVGLADSAKG